MRTVLWVSVFGACAQIEPTTIRFADHEYDVRHGQEVCLFDSGVVVRCLGAGSLLAFDLTGDGTSDLALYQDTRDGFRDTFAYLDIYANDGTPLVAAPRIQAKWKQQHWVWIDERAFPGLRAPWFEHFMRSEDAAHDE